MYTASCAQCIIQTPVGSINIFNPDETLCLFDHNITHGAIKLKHMAWHKKTKTHGAPVHQELQFFNFGQTLQNTTLN